MSDGKLTFRELSDGAHRSPDEVASMEFGIVANVIETDRLARTGAKAWLIGGTGGEGWHRFVWHVMTRGSRYIEKWMPTHRMGNFRAAWVPEHLRDRVAYMRGTRPEMETRAVELNKFADDLRATQVNRRNAPATKSQPL